MGYDMYWRTKDPEEAAAVAAARERWNVLIDERNAIPAHESGRFNRNKADALGDWEAHGAYDGRSERFIAAYNKAHAAFEAMLDAEKSYFRLNVHGMSVYCNLMFRIGMLFEDDPHPPWPHAEDFGITDEDYSALKYPEDYPGHSWTDERLVATLKFKDAHDAILDFHGKTDTPGIPDSKFSTSDGWHVLPVEAEAAARIWQKFVDDNGEEKALAIVSEYTSDTSYWLKWIAYLLGSVKHDGFEVH